MVETWERRVHVQPEFSTEVLRPRARAGWQGSEAGLVGARVYAYASDIPRNGARGARSSSPAALHASPRVRSPGRSPAGCGCYNVRRHLADVPGAGRAGEPSGRRTASLRQHRRPWICQRPYPLTIGRLSRAPRLFCLPCAGRAPPSFAAGRPAFPEWRCWWSGSLAAKPRRGAGPLSSTLDIDREPEESRAISDVRGVCERRLSREATRALATSTSRVMRWPIICSVVAALGKSHPGSLPGPALTARD